MGKEHKYMQLDGKRVAIFVANYYEDLEFWYPYYRMKEEGAEVVVIGPARDSYAGKHGLPAKSEKAIDDVNAGNFDALIIPGGYSPDLMRRSPKMVEFVKNMYTAGKPVAAICHGGWMLASAGVVKGKKLTSFYSIKDDMINAGAEWIDSEVVKTDNLITSRKPDDLPAFCREIINTLAGERQEESLHKEKSYG
jgi:protease I